ncbi:MAG: ATP-binding protein [Gammaproteobacteria bacterium]|jgi:two-component system sensor histidine kinase QseC
MNLSIRKRLLFGLLSLMTIACSITLVKNYFDTRHEIQELFDAQLAQSARVLLELSAHELYEQLAYAAQQGEDISEHIATQIHKYQQEIDFQIWVANGLLAVRSENAPSNPFVNVDEQFSDRIFNDKRWRVYSISNDDGTIRVQVGQHYDERDLLSNSISTRLITSFAIMLPLLALLILASVRQAMAPLKKITDQIENRQIDNLQPISLHHVPQEVVPMIKALNSLFQRLHSAFENITLFTANAAHELRTPLAGQKIHAQVAMQADDKNTRDEALKEVVLGVNRATSLVEQLLTLSRLDPEGALKEDEVANLYKITEDKLAELTPQALEKFIEVSLDFKDSPLVNGKEAMLTILVRNIIENAIRYTPKHGMVEVQVRPVDDKVLFSVKDSGPGIPVEEQQNVFQRFYRGKGNTTQEGSGLGLAMVHRILEIHNAEVKLGKSPFGGLQVDVLFNPATAVPTLSKNTSSRTEKRKREKSTDVASTVSMGRP